MASSAPFPGPYVCSCRLHRPGQRRLSRGGPQGNSPAGKAALSRTRGPSADPSADPSPQRGPQHARQRVLQRVHEAHHSAQGRPDVAGRARYLRDYLGATRVKGAGPFLRRRYLCEGAGPAARERGCPLTKCTRSVRSAAPSLPVRAAAPYLPVRAAAPLPTCASPPPTYL